MNIVIQVGAVFLPFDCKGAISTFLLASPEVCRAKLIDGRFTQNLWCTHTSVSLCVSCRE
jgi:hypothetical protein